MARHRDFQRFVREDFFADSAHWIPRSSKSTRSGAGSGANCSLEGCRDSNPHLQCPFGRCYLRRVRGDGAYHPDRFNEDLDWDIAGNKVGQSGGSAVRAVAVECGGGMTLIKRAGELIL